MLSMEQYEHIRVGRRVYGRGIRELSRETGHSRNTIRRMLRGEQGGYATRQRQAHPVLGRLHDVIDGWLAADRDVPKKQRHTAKRVFDRLVEEHGFLGSASNVRRYVRDAKVRLGTNAPSVFIPLDPSCGQEAEVDWGSAVVIVEGQETRVHIFCMRSRYSGKHFVGAYVGERQQAFFDGHMRSWAFFGGVFPVHIYDNLRSAVRRVLEGRKRREQESFQRFRGYYDFTSRYCNRNAGHEKGGVENLVGYCRRNYLVPIPRVDSLEELNDQLLRQCLRYGSHRLAGRERTVAEFFEEEKEHLLRLPEVPFSNVQLGEGKVDKYSTVIVDKNRYSVPTRYGGLRVRVEVGVDTVAISQGGRRIAMHQRVYGNNKWCLDPDHYLELLQQRPQAFDSARPIRAWRKTWPESWERMLARFRACQGDSKGTKDFVSVLMLQREHARDRVEAAVERALETRLSTSDGVRHLLLHTGQGITPPALPTWPVTPRPDVSVYQQLGGVR